MDNDDFETFLKGELGDTFKEAQTKAQDEALNDMAVYLRAVYKSNRKSGFGRLMSLAITLVLFKEILGVRNA